MPVIEGASRNIPKATYVPLQVTPPTSDTGQALLKWNFARQLALQTGEVDKALQTMTMATQVDGTAAAVSSDSPIGATLRAFEGTPMTSQLPSRTSFVSVSTATLTQFGNAVIANRTPAGGAAPAGVALAALNTAVQAVHALATNVAATPVGMLNLERLEMTPAGIVPGELIATVCLAPGEKTSVEEKEWSVTTKEFTSIVTDSLDNYSETGVTDNTELAQSTNSQIAHANQFNISASASGGCGFVSGSASASFGAQDSKSTSAADSRKHAITTTRKASSRVKQEHKTTISTTTVTGQAETTARMLVNPSDTAPMRVDYFSLMRKWRVRLYRYGLRMTYDVGVPEPGAAMREAYKQLDMLTKQAATGFTFPVQYEDINQQLVDSSGNYVALINALTGSAGTSAGIPKYLWLAQQYGAQVPPPPEPKDIQVGGQEVPIDNTKPADWVFFYPLDFTVDSGYWIEGGEVAAYLGQDYVGGTTTLPGIRCSAPDSNSCRKT
jgi:hypothetical protein